MVRHVELDLVFDLTIDVRHVDLLESMSAVLFDSVVDELKLSKMQSS